MKIMKALITMIKYRINKERSDCFGIFCEDMCCAPNNSKYIDRISRRKTNG